MRAMRNLTMRLIRGSQPVSRYEYKDNSRYNSSKESDDHPYVRALAMDA